MTDYAPEMLTVKIRLDGLEFDPSKILNDNMAVIGFGLREHMRGKKCYVWDTLLRNMDYCGDKNETNHLYT